MIKIYNSNFTEPIILSKEMPYFSLVIENPDFLSKFIKEILNAMNNEETSFQFYHNDEKFCFNKYAVFIPNVFTLEFNDKKNISALYKNLTCDFYNSANQDAFSKINESITDLFDNISNNYSVPLCCDELDFISLLKAVDMKFFYKDSGVVENIINYVKIMSTIKEVRFVVFLNLELFLNNIDIELLKKELSDNGVYILFLEGRNTESLKSSDRCRVITTDLSEIGD